MKYADQIDYRLSLKKDGTFKLEFRMVVPSITWVEAVQKRVGKNPPAVVEIHPKMYPMIESNKSFQKMLEKIREDASKKFGVGIGFATPRVKSAKIVKEGGEYYLKVVVVGAWAPV